MSTRSWRDIEHSFRDGSRFDIGWVHRDFRKGNTTVEVNGIYNNGVFVGYRDESQNAISKQTNNVWNWRVYDDISFQVAKQSTRLQLLASYTRQWRHLDGTWQPNDPASFIQPEAFPNNKDVGGPTSTGSSSYPQFPGYWLDHVVRTAATVNLPLGVQLSGVWNIQSGPWSGPIYTRLPAADPRFGPALVTLSNGRQVQNPLSTTLRFAYPTRSDGQLKNEALHMLNARVGKQFKVRAAQATIALEMFNVINADADQGFQSTTNTDSNFGMGSNRQVPRSGQLTFGLRF